MRDHTFCCLKVCHNVFDSAQNSSFSVKTFVTHFVTTEIWTLMYYYDFWTFYTLDASAIFPILISRGGT